MLKAEKGSSLTYHLYEVMVGGGIVVLSCSSYSIELSCLIVILCDRYVETAF